MNLSEENEKEIAADAAESPEIAEDEALKAQGAELSKADKEDEIKTEKTEKPKKQKRSILSYERKKGLYGYGFIALWMIGTLIFFIIPLIKSIDFSFRNVLPADGGMEGPYVGFANYYEAFANDPQYWTLLVDVLKDTVIQTPLILIFSLFIAVILNQEFKGRVLSRAIFFLPVIIVTGPVYSIITGNISTSGADSASQFSTMFETDLVGELLNFIGIYNISTSLTEVIQTLTNEILNIVWSSGIQILVFLAALQNIPHSAKEAAQMEGATAWEYFWKITFPYVSPMILANFIYTVIDKFTDPTNPVMARILEKQQVEWEYGLAAAMAWSYFLIILAGVGLIVGLINKFVYYEVD
ncbi:MAG: sugar ABC transporter permease [Oscillospiraceae bacterium]|nr:sugar ABC transporter permease [Oscillospiraceae bacterium]